MPRLAGAEGEGTMHTLILLIVVSNIYLLLYLFVRVKPDWFMDVGQAMPCETGGVETEDQKCTRIADDALFGPSCSNCETRIAEAGRESLVKREMQDAPNGMQHQ